MTSNVINIRLEIYIFLENIYLKCLFLNQQLQYPCVGISGTTAKLRKCIFVPLSHPGPLAVVASSWKSQTKAGTLAYFDFLNKLTM